MKRTLSRLISSIVLAGGLAVLFTAVPLAQQFTHNTTTLAAAQGVSDTTISLTSAAAATGSSFGAVQVGQFVYVDQELELITGTTTTSTIFQVQRRQRVAAHANGSPVYIGAAGSFMSAPPAPGPCVVANFPKFWINIGPPGAGGPGSNGLGGDIYTCPPNLIVSRGGTPWLTGMNSGNGATVTLTAADSGKTFLFDRAAGIIYTLPKPVPGMVFEFVTSVSVTSNAYTVQTDSGSTFVGGAIALGSAGTSIILNCNGTSHVKVASDGATKGGLIGSYQKWVAVSSTLWNVSATLAASGTAATPCA